MASDTGGETIHTEQRAKGSASTPSLLCHLVTEAQSYQQSLVAVSTEIVLLFLVERCCTLSFQVIHLVVCWDCALGPQLGTLPLRSFQSFLDSQRPKLHSGDSWGGFPNPKTTIMRGIPPNCRCFWSRKNQRTPAIFYKSLT